MKKTLLILLFASIMIVFTTSCGDSGSAQNNISSADQKEIEANNAEEEEVDNVVQREESNEKLTFLGKNDKGYKEYLNKKDGTTLILIPSGEFTMGGSSTDNEKPEHAVYLEDYYISKYEITNAQYKRFCDETGKTYPEDPEFQGENNYFIDYSNYPVTMISWMDAVEYCRWAGLRLPSEAEWEKASKGIYSRSFPWGEKDPRMKDEFYANVGCHDKDGYLYTSPVGTFQIGESPYGVRDMIGNVYEWCSDWYNPQYYASGESQNPMGPATGTDKVCRGGSWYSNEMYSLTCSSRGSLNPERKSNTSGFRPAM
jgi:formylglycine-generating enzyme required for sulfatase activity